MTPPEQHEVLSLPEAAALLGVHYMTAYRYVRTGKLPATLVGGQWQVDRDALAALQLAASSKDAVAPRQRVGSRAALVDALVRRLVEGDAEGAFQLCEAALASWARPADLHLELVAPAMRSIGDRWANGELSVADEHRAVAVANRVLGRLGPAFIRPGRRRGTVVIGAPEGDQHALPVALVGDLLRAEGWSVIDLGADIPAQAFVTAAQRADRLRAVAIGATLAGNEVAIRKTTGALHEALPGVGVLVGGAGVSSESESDALGADLWTGTDGRTVVELIAGLAPRLSPS